MPEYRVVPSGVWHMLAAVFLLIICLSIAVMLMFSTLAPLFSERALILEELGILVLLLLFFSAATILVSRGRSLSHVFLVWYNRA